VGSHACSLLALPGGIVLDGFMENAQAPPPPAPAPAPEKKKGMPAIAWVGIGCGTILVLIVIVIALLVGKCKRFVEEVQANPEKAAAEMVVNFNPDLDMVSQDDATGQMTIRNNKTGETVTLDYADIAEGRLTVTDGDGTVSQIGTGSAEQAPSWVPRLPDSESALSVFHRESDSEISGVLSIKTKMSPEEVEAVFEDAAEKEGMSSSGSKSVSMNNTVSKTLVYQGGSKTLNVQITGSGGKPLMVQVAYTEKK
jgi:hypothetical protein